MTFRNHFLLEIILLTKPKCYIFEIDKSTFQVVKWHIELILYLLTSPKFDLDEFD